MDCRAVKQLATRIVNQLGGKESFCLRVQGTLGGVKRETGPSASKNAGRHLCFGPCVARSQANGVLEARGVLAKPFGIVQRAR